MLLLLFNKPTFCKHASWQLSICFDNSLAVKLSKSPSKWLLLVSLAGLVLAPISHDRHKIKAITANIDSIFYFVHFIFWFSYSAAREIRVFCHKTRNHQNLLAKKSQIDWPNLSTKYQVEVVWFLLCEISLLLFFSTFSSFFIRTFCHEKNQVHTIWWWFWIIFFQFLSV